MAMSQDAMALIRQWEGCRLSAYPDPASGGEPWTIGYGHTGPQVKPGQRITQEQAERWLLEDLAAAEAAVVRLLQPPAGMSQRQREALTSFCFNVGSGALAGSTLRRRLNGGEPVAKVLEEELPRWVKGPNGPMEGLVRRRQAELAHARGGRAPSTPGEWSPHARSALLQPARQRHRPWRSDVLLVHLRDGGGLPQARLPFRLGPAG